MDNNVKMVAFESTNAVLMDQRIVPARKETYEGLKKNYLNFINVASVSTTGSVVEKEKVEISFSLMDINVDKIIYNNSKKLKLRGMEAINSIAKSYTGKVIQKSESLETLVEEPHPTFVSQPVPSILSTPVVEEPQIKEEPESNYFDFKVDEDKYKNMAPSKERSASIDLDLATRVSPSVDENLATAEKLKAIVETAKKSSMLAEEIERIKRETEQERMEKATLQAEKDRAEEEARKLEEKLGETQRLYLDAENQKKALAAKYDEINKIIRTFGSEQPTKLSDDEYKRAA